MHPVIRHIKNIDAVKDVCGELRVLSTAKDFKKANVAMAEMSGPTTPHYHKIATEFYFVINGCGKLIVAQNVFEIQYRSLVIIPPNYAHYTIPRKKMNVLAFSVPAWTSEDQLILKEGSIEAGYSCFVEKLALLNELLCREGLAIKKSMSCEKVEEVEEKRRRLLLENRWNHMSVVKLRELLRV